MENLLELTLDELHKRGKMGTRIYNALVVACKKDEKAYSEITLQDVVDFFDIHKDSSQGGLGHKRNLGPAVIFPVLNLLIESGIDVKNRWEKLSNHIEKKTTRVLQNLKVNPNAPSASFLDECKQAYQEGNALRIEKEYAPELQKLKESLPGLIKEAASKGEKMVYFFKLEKGRDFTDNSSLKPESLGKYIHQNLVAEGLPLMDEMMPQGEENYLVLNLWSL